MPREFLPLWYKICNIPCRPLEKCSTFANLPQAHIFTCKLPHINHTFVANKRVFANRLDPFSIVQPLWYVYRPLVFIKQTDDCVHQSLNLHLSLLQVINHTSHHTHSRFFPLALAFSFCPLFHSISFSLSPFFFLSHLTAASETCSLFPRQQIMSRVWVLLGQLYPSPCVSVQEGVYLRFPRCTFLYCCIILFCDFVHL